MCIVRRWIRGSSLYKRPSQYLVARTQYGELSEMYTELVHGLEGNDDDSDISFDETDKGKH